MQNHQKARHRFLRARKDLLCQMRSAYLLQSGADEGACQTCLWIDTVFPFRFSVRFLGFWVPGPRFVMVGVFS